ncbi:hypothetical protein PC9H_007961 [Pleurotus ostreatus]|uniref:AAA protein C-terminal winged helix domain-containing protein n=1 Tax=Pleurotus ostreatus TaxID=5322 RepID=A0A8H7DQN6_PLEOS|nr:uncharacterized protein PC9H_007961 [Pleurotus ostreatus]KAF7428731.1 hypothetical protein PC9H_007961 [Pleurotus ostreatus]
MIPLPLTRRIPGAYLRASLTRAYTPGSNSSSSGQRPTTVHPHAAHAANKPITKPKVPPTSKPTPHAHAHGPAHASQFASPIKLASATPPSPRHEVHEGTSALSVPFNFPGAGGGSGPGGASTGGASTGNPLLDAALTTIVGLGMVFLGGVGYIKWYKKNVLDKIELAFAPGYDPALELANASKKGHTQHTHGMSDWLRKEQDLIDRMIKGEEAGHYFILLGPKGSGKGTMIFDAMSTIDADGVAMCDAHPDLEVFRLRLGKALNYEFNEDTQTGLFQRRDPREGGPSLDIERALNKLEKVALSLHARRHKPIVLIINNVHYFKNDDEGKNMLLQLQQKAEAWAASGVCTILFSSDDYWPFYHLRRSATRMHVLSIYDLNYKESVHALKRMRQSDDQETTPTKKRDVFSEIVAKVGGRLGYLNKVARHKDMHEMADHLLSVEKASLLSQIGLIADHDDDVMDEQKWSSCSWLLLREFVRARYEQEKEHLASCLAKGIKEEDVDYSGLDLPKISYYRSRQIMTRTDFLEDLDRANIISIDAHHDIRPDSMLILHAAREMCEEEGFDELLDEVRDRIDEIESLHRTRELTVSDFTELIKLILGVGEERGKWS